MWELKYGEVNEWIIFINSWRSWNLPSLQDTRGAILFIISLVFIRDDLHISYVYATLTMVSNCSLQSQY